MASTCRHSNVLMCAASVAMAIQCRAEVPVSRDSVLMQLQSWHMNDASSQLAKVECSEYMSSTGCSWTAAWNCPKQPTGTNGPASDDGTVGYKCCCEKEMWKAPKEADLTSTPVEPEVSSTSLGDESMTDAEDDGEEEPIYRINLARTCEDAGMLTISTLNECREAARELTGYALITFPLDQPVGGYPTAEVTSPRGCAMHLLDLSKPDEKQVHFYPNANGECGSNMFLCFCKEVLEPPAPTPAPSSPPTAALLPACMTCTPDDLCFQDVSWTMVHGFQVQPEWYGSGEVDESSCFEDVQMFLYLRQQKDRSHWDGMLAHPIPSPCWRQQMQNYVKDDLLYCR